MNGNGFSSAAGETSSDDNTPSLPNEAENGGVRREEDDSDEEEDSEEDDDGEEEEEDANGNGNGDGDIEEYKDEEVDIIAVDQEIADVEIEIEIEVEIDVSMEESTQSKSSSSSSSSSSSAAADEDSSESDSEEESTEPRIFHGLPPNFPLEFTKRIEDPQSIRPRILMETKLRGSDVDENRNRLPIPAKKMKEAFLLPEEEERLSAGEDMEVELIEPGGGSVSAVTLRRLGIGEDEAAPSYALTGEWSQVVARNCDALKRGGRIRVWYFRVGGGVRLWFAIEVVEEGKREDSEVVKELTEKWLGQNVFAP